MFESILFDRPGQGEQAQTAPPPYFADLRLSQVVEALTAGREEYDLGPFFYAPLDDPDAIAYRQEVFEDLQSPALHASLGSFSEGMRAARERIAQALGAVNARQGARWFLDAAHAYCETALSLAADSALAQARSRGLRGFRGYLASYVQAPAFCALREEVERCEAAFSEIVYCIDLRGTRITVSAFRSEPDLSASVRATFQRFTRESAKDYRVGFPDHTSLNHVEEEVLERDARLYPEAFRAAEAFRERWQGFLDETVRRFDREIQFYLAYSSYIDGLRAAGLPFCYPRVSPQCRETQVRGAFDLALGHALSAEGRGVVRQDLQLAGPERVLVVTGPNQGGKTTFARMFGQLHHLARLGVPVPGTDAQLLLCDRIETHFAREERLEDQQGRLKDELLRMREILSAITDRSVVVMNESFSSTTLHDSRRIGAAVLQQLIERGALGVYVTFVDELAALSEATVSMVAGIAPGDPSGRTYTLARRPADGRAYALAIAERHGLTYDAVRRRIAR